MGLPEMKDISHRLWLNNHFKDAHDMKNMIVTTALVNTMQTLFPGESTM
jgi:hypothetical protein